MADAWRMDEMISFRPSASAEQRGFDGEVPRFSKAWAGECRGCLASTRPGSG